MDWQSNSIIMKIAPEFNLFTSTLLISCILLTAIDYVLITKKSNSQGLIYIGSLKTLGKPS